MREKRLLILSFLVFLYIAPMIFIPSYLSPAIVEPTDKAVFAEGEYWLPGYEYRKKLNFQNVTGAGTDYNIWIELVGASGFGVDGNNTVDLDTLEQADFGDVRFTSSDGITELDYWIEEYVGGTFAYVWVEIDANLSLAGQSAYIYWYTDGTSTTTSSGPDTFLLFDDFEDGTLNAWNDTDNMQTTAVRTHDSSSYSASWIASNNAHIKDNGYGGLNGIKLSAWVNQEDTLRGSFHYVYSEDDYSEQVATVRGAYESSTSPMYYRDSGSYVIWPGSVDDINDDEWDLLEFAVDFSEDKMVTWQNEVLNGHLAVVEDDGTVLETQECDGVGLMIQSGKQTWFDDVIVRKWNGAGEPYMSGPSTREYYVPAWKEAEGPARIYFQVRLDTTAMDWLLIFVGLAMIPFSTCYLVYGGRKNFSPDKMFYGIILLAMGLALFIGGIYG